MQEIQEIQERPCGGGALTRPGERKTENGEQSARQAGDGEEAFQETKGRKGWAR